jgi:hypothetical protein
MIRTYMEEDGREIDPQMDADGRRWDGEDSIQKKGTC